MPPLVPPTGPPDPFDSSSRPQPARPAEGTGFADVIDLAMARAERTRRSTAEVQIPDTVLDEMDAASRMFHVLHAQGHELRFDERLGRVRAELHTLDGEFVRRVSLREAVDVLGDPVPPAPDAA